jgi:hypothetical protein
MSLTDPREGVLAMSLTRRSLAALAAAVLAPMAAAPAMDSPSATPSAFARDSSALADFPLASIAASSFLNPLIAPVASSVTP